jgi:N-acetylneuraminic acid mutarotase
MIHVNGFTRVACTALLSLAALGASAQQAPTFTQRVKAEEALERVRYAHRIWPKENKGPKPPFDEAVPRAAIEARVTDYLRKSAALARLWGKPITPRDLQAEISRMAVHSKDPGRLQEMFDALGDDPVLIAECLARPALADRWVAHRFEGGLPSGPLAHGSLQRTRAGFQDWWARTAPTLPSFSASSDAAATSYTLPRLAGSACGEGWSPMAGSAPRGRDSAFYVYTGSEVIFWGGYDGAELGSGARYDPATDTWIPMSSGPGVPSARMAGPAGSVQAVWTGTEMIVWGGLTVSGGTTYLKTGGRYNPTTDTWTPTSTGLFCPNERADHAVVWTGTEMVIWGGGQPYTNSGARYDPASDTWAPTSTGSGCPSPRAGHSTAWTGSEMIVWGGEYGGAPLSDGARYAPDTDSWTPIASGAGAPSARAHATAVWTGSQMIVWGGDAPAALNSGGRYNPLSDSWTPTSSGTGCPAPRSGHGALWTGSEMIVWGGDGPAALDTGGRYDPNSDAWTPTSTQSGCPTGRWGAVVVWTGTEMMVWGGADPSAGRPRTGGRYKPLTDSWTPTAVDGPSPRMNATAVWTGAEMIVWGGSDPTTRLGDGAAYDPATDHWTALPGGPDCPSPREFHTAVWTGTEMIVWGGTDGGPYPGARYFNDGGRYDPATGLWSKTSTGVGCPPPRGWQTAVWTGNEMIVWGGNNGTVLLDTGGRYAPSSDSWQATSTAAGCPSPRNLHLAVWTGSEMIIWGGAHVAPRNIWTPLNTGSRYDPASDTWTAISAGAGCPAPRAGAQGVWTGTELVVWGGEGTNLPPVVAFDDGGRYDPQADGWQATSLAVGCPSGRLLHQAFWTGSEVIVWGGTTGAEYPQLGGRYDPEPTPGRPHLQARAVRRGALPSRRSGPAEP